MDTIDSESILITLLLLTTFFVGILFWLVVRIRAALKHARPKQLLHQNSIHGYIENLEEEKIDFLLTLKKAKSKSLHKATLLPGAILLSQTLTAQPTVQPSLLQQPGIIITLSLIFIVVFAIILLVVAKTRNVIRKLKEQSNSREATLFAEYLKNIDESEIESTLLQRKHALNYKLSNTELAGFNITQDEKGLIYRKRNGTQVDFVATKTRAPKVSAIDPKLSRLILWYLGLAVFWLILGTTAGEYLGIKFVAPDVDHQSWLSFGRLRPVHTNAVFWGWSSLAMLGLAYYVVPIVSNTAIRSIREGWIALVLINASVLIGSICLMAGINNGGGEYREYTWPVMALFGGGLVLSLKNFLQTIAKRTTREIYISNWYIISAIIFTLVIAFIAYWPTWQNGLGETIIQGYYMHQGVGMWFMLFNLGLIYYFLPQQLNKPIYSYSLGILAFWTQILFYTLIGSHHFVFSSIPWSLQTVAIVGSVGMLIPVAAGTINFYMTLRGSWEKVSNSYVLPFFVVGIVFYFTGSYQGTAEAFRYTNQLWHFTDFTVAHSHLTMYGIIAFILWGGIYVVIPRLTGNEPSQVAVGAHFWLALIGLMCYTIPLMLGGTLKGMLWMDGKPFMDSVTMMAPYWLWRAIGGTMMWLSHLVFAYNFYRMVSPKKQTDIPTLAFEKLKSMEEETVNA